MSIAHVSLPVEGLIAVVKRDCPTCVLIEPVLAELALGGNLTVFTQDDPVFPESIEHPVDDTALNVSHALAIEIVPTLIRREAGAEIDRTFGWDRSEWQRVSGQDRLGADLPALRPGCGALNVEPAKLEDLLIRFEQTGLNARKVEFGEDEDEIEAIYQRGWTD
jgi:hypothetical protein